ncbi:hypothetical protein ACWGRF_19700 [Streptomyces zhihengii]|uniref:hypothetical protein n=1 Tax=Streptomyces zhihengii TaxID=1818004 RepID=UPI00362B731B
MNDRVSPPLQALPDGEAELRLVVRLAWEDVAALGREAGRLATRMQRPVSLDEAAGHRLRLRSGAHSAPPPAQPAGPERAQQLPPPAPSSVSSLTARSPGEHARQAIEKINGTAGAAGGGRDAAPTPA